MPDFSHYRETHFYMTLPTSCPTSKSSMVKALQDFSSRQHRQEMIMSILFSKAIRRAMMISSNCLDPNLLPNHRRGQRALLVSQV